MTFKPYAVLSAIAALAFVFTAGWSLADDQKPVAAGSPEQIAAARELMTVTGAAKQFEAVMPMMLAQFEPLFLKMAPGHESEVKEVLAQLMIRFDKRKGEMMEAIAGIYAQKFTADDIKELTKFFSVGAGKRFTEMQPEIVQESMIAGQSWGQKIGQEIETEMREELKKRGIKI